MRIGPFPRHVENGITWDHRITFLEGKVKAQELWLLGFLEFIHIGGPNSLQTVLILVCH